MDVTNDIEFKWWFVLSVIQNYSEYATFDILYIFTLMHLLKNPPSNGNIQESFIFPVFPKDRNIAIRIF